PCNLNAGSEIACKLAEVSCQEETRAGTRTRRRGRPNTSRRDTSPAVFRRTKPSGAPGRRSTKCMEAARSPEAEATESHPPKAGPSSRQRWPTGRRLRRPEVTTPRERDVDLYRSGLLPPPGKQVFEVRPLVR